jgi:sarcosine oxidase subunit beta
LNKTADVAIIGGGAIGCAVSYYLAKEGAEVILLERTGGLLYGASGACHGGCPIPLPGSTLFDYEIESIRLLKNLPQEIDCDIEYEKVGQLTCVIDEAHYPYAEKQVQDFKNIGVDARLLKGDTIRSLEPAIGPKIIGGVEEWESGIFNPLKTVHGLARAAVRLGAKIHFFADVKSIAIENGKVTSVITSNTNINTRWIVNAAGTGAPRIGDMVGITVPVVPLRGQIVVTEPVPLSYRWRRIKDAVYLTGSLGVRAAAESTDPIVKLGIVERLLMQERSGNWLIGTSRDFAGYDNRVTLSTIRHLTGRAMDILPGLRHLNCVRVFAGLRPWCSIDERPILGGVDSPSGFVLATGHGSGGVVLAPISGKLISEVITKGKTSMPIDLFAFSRFSENLI